MESDECAAAIRCGEAVATIDEKIVRRPVRRKRGNGRLLASANADLLAAVASIFGSEHEFVLLVVEVALGPAIVCTLLDAEKLLRRELSALLRLIEVGPILRELIAPMR